MSELGQWLFQQEREKLRKELAQAMPYTARVASVDRASLTCKVTDLVSGQVDNTPIRIVGPWPTINQRVVVIPTRSGGRVALVNQPARNPPVGSALGGNGRFVSLRNIYPIGYSSTVSLAPNTAYYMPVYIPNHVSVNAIRMEITGFTANGNLAAAIYECAWHMVPITADTPRIAYTNLAGYTGNGIKDVFLVSPVTLLGGQWYWLALAVTVQTGVRGATPGYGIPNPAMGVVGDFGATSSLGWAQNLTAGFTQLPAAGGYNALCTSYVDIMAGVTDGWMETQ